MSDQMTGLVLISHGDFALESLKSAEMIMGHQENVKTISVVLGMDLSETVRKLSEAVNEVKGSMGVIIMTDIIGGTPSNAASILTASMDGTLVLSGFNMPMLLETLTLRTSGLSEIAEKVCSIGRQSIVNLTDTLKKSLK
jgi:Phosphotransferase system, mannose/fructose-specific component IIA